MATLKNTTINTTGFVQLAVGTTAQRSGSPSNGMARFNTTTSRAEVYTNGVWADMIYPLGSYNNPATSAQNIIQTNPNAPSGVYWIKPGTNPNILPVYCDMTTDGGGWMLIARSHPSSGPGSGWGWRGTNAGSLTNYSTAYQLSWLTNFGNYGATFTAFLFGNRQNINNNNWGAFVYKRSNIDYNTFSTQDTQQYYDYTTVKSDTSVYGSTNPPGMQTAVGYWTSGTNSNFYYLRDCCGFATYGAYPTYMQTTYCGSDSVALYSGPWCGGSSTDSNGNFLSGTYVTAGGNRYGGTNQYMIMVR